MCAAEPALCGGVCAECSRLPPPRQIAMFVCFLPILWGPFVHGSRQVVSSHTLNVSKKSGAAGPPSGHICILQVGLMSSRDEFQDGFVEVAVFLCVLYEGSLSNLNEAFIMGVPSLTKSRQNTVFKQKNCISRLHPFEFERQRLFKEAKIIISLHMHSSS